MTIVSLRYSRTNKNDVAAAATPTEPTVVYFVTALILTMETFKFAITLLMFIIVQMKGSVGQALKLINQEVICRPYDTVQLAIPGSFYILQDNLIIFALSCLDAGTHQVVVYFK